VRRRSWSASIPIMAVLRKSIGSFPKKLRDHALGGSSAVEKDVSRREKHEEARDCTIARILLLNAALLSISVSSLLRKISS
jgi:hypothetical protein